MRISSSRGFTLLEIMIVIAMIGILSAALYPSYVNYVQRGRDTARVSTIDTISKALTLFYSEHEDYPESDLAGCVNSTSLLGYIESKKLNDPQLYHTNGACGTPGLFSYAMSTGIILPTASPDEFALMATMEQEFGGNYTGSLIGFTGTLSSTAYTSGTTLTEKGAGPYYIRIP